MNAGSENAKDYINRVDIYVEIVGHWSLSREDPRLYEERQFWKNRYFDKEPYPSWAAVEPPEPELDKTMDVTLEISGEPYQLGQPRRAGEHAPPHDAPTPVYGPAATPGTSGSFATPSHPAPPTLSTPHPDPGAFERYTDLKEYFRSGEQLHHHYAMGAEAHGFSYCQNYLAMKNDRVVKEIEKGSLNCKKCKRDFTSTQKLRDHVRRYHSSSDKYKCSLCDKRLGDSQALKHHLSQIHKQVASQRKAPHSSCLPDLQGQG